MTLEDALTEITTALEPLTAVIPGLQINRYLNNEPTPPTIDIYRADPFQVGAGFGVDDVKVAWMIRARVSYADPQAASQLMLRLVDTEDSASVEAALQDVCWLSNEGAVSGDLVFDDTTTGGLLGTTWRMEMFV